MAEASRRRKHEDIEWTKVKSHKDPTEQGIQDIERKRRLGNDWADKTAKEALRMHDQCPEEEAEAIIKKTYIVKTK